MRGSTGSRTQISSQVMAALVVCCAALTLLLSVSTALAQVRFEVPLYVTCGTDRDTLYFGILPGANFCIVESDSINGHIETFLPPIPPGGIFDTRFVWPRTGSNLACFDQGSAYDYRPFTVAAQKDTLRFKTQYGTGATLILGWPSDLSTRFTGLTLRYFDQVQGQNVNVNMLTTFSVDATDAGDLAPVTMFSAGLIIPVVPPPTPSLIVPANGATGQPTSLTLRWRSSSGAQTYHVQVSTDSLFGSLFLNDSTLTDTLRAVSGLSFSTKYHWRVRAKNTGGTSSFSAPFNFTTQFQPPVAPTLVSPPNGQTNVPISIMLAWNAVSGAVTYRVQVATDAGFSGIIVDDSTLTTTSRTVGPLQNSTQYFWRVNAKNPGGPGPYSAVWNFTTVILPPAAPTLLSPPNGAQNVSLLPTLTWGSTATATSYRLQVARDTLFGVLVFDDSTLTGISRQVGQLLPITPYYWRVRAKNAAGAGPYSERFGFTTTATPPAPVLIAPPDSAIRVSRTPTMIWSQVLAATSYHLQIGTDPTFTTLVVNDSTIAETTKVVAPLPYGARLFWRVRARNTSGASPYSLPRVFTVMLEPPGTPTQLVPANNALNVPAGATFRWTTASLAAAYHLQIAFDTLMTNLFINDSTVADTVRDLRIAPSTAYYWRVRAVNTEHTYGSYSPVRRLTTISGPPAVPLPTYPLEGATNVSRVPRLQWLGSPGAVAYWAQLSLNSAFTLIVSQDSLITTAYFLPGLLDPLTSYYWRVRAKGTLGWSANCVAQRFTTGTLIVGVDEDPELSHPTDFVLHQNYPNPFNPSTQIQFSIPSPAQVTLAVYNMLGQEIQTLVAEEMPAGTYTTRWRGEHANGESMSSGIYLVRMIAVDAARTFSATRKIMLLR